MTSLPLAMVLFLAGGILYGLTFCNLTCGPLLAVRLGNRARGWKDGAILATIYSIPRIAVLMIFGAIVGGLSGVASYLFDRGIITSIQAMAYIAIGMIMVLNGIQHASDLGSCNGGGILNRTLKLVQPRVGREERLYMYLLGALFSLACLSEVWIILTASVIGTTIESDPLAGAGFGMLGMGLFGIGLSLPLIALSAIVSEAGKKYDLRNLMRSGGYVLVVLGALIVIYEIITVIRVVT
jgi:hypothetical protein